MEKRIPLDAAMDAAVAVEARSIARRFLPEVLKAVKGKGEHTFSVDRASDGTGSDVYANNWARKDDIIAHKACFELAKLLPDEGYNVERIDTETTYRWIVTKKEGAKRHAR